MKHPRLMAALFGLLPALPTLTLTAQDAGWPVETRCVGEPTAPPERWTFDGTILLYGPYGIHGLKADWDTTHVLAFTGGYRILHFNGGLSPDKQWIAGPVGYAQLYSNSNIQDFFVTDFALFDISGNHPREVRTIPWAMAYAVQGYYTDQPNIVWLDNQHIIYPIDPEGMGMSYNDDAFPHVLNPFTGEKYAYDNDYYRRSSPDFTRSLIYNDADNFYELEDAKSGTVIRTFDLEKFLPFPKFTEIWSPNSDYFLNVHLIDERTIDIALYTRDGVFVNSILELDISSSNALFVPNAGLDIVWSPDSKYFWGEFAFPPAHKGRYLVDVDQQQIIDPCLPLDGNYIAFEWSPNSRQLAAGMERGRQHQVIVFDLDDWKLYKVGYLDGYVIGWRED